MFCVFDGWGFDVMQCSIKISKVLLDFNYDIIQDPKLKAFYIIVICVVKSNRFIFSVGFTCADIKSINALIRTFIYLAHDQLCFNDKKFLFEMIYTFQSFFGLFIVDGKFGVDMKGFDIIQRKKHLYHICDTMQKQRKRKRVLYRFLFAKKGNQIKEERRKIIFILIVIGIGTFITLW